MKVQVLCDDAWHPAGLIQRGLQPLADIGAEFDFVANADDWSPDSLNNFSVIIVAKGNHVSSTNQVPWLKNDNQSAFRKFVRNGGGLFAVHGGTGYRDIGEMRALCGGALLDHPDPCLVTVEPRPGHALTQGVEPFSELDEHYRMVLDDPRANVFLRSRSRYGEQPAGWTRTEGSGRVCVLTPGHNSEVWRNAGFQILLRNGLRWLAKQI